MNVDCSPQADDFIGPRVVGCREGFDFTLLFEQAILSIVPSVLVLVVSCLYVVYLYKQSIKAITQKWKFLRYIKLTALVCFAATQIALIVLWTSSSSYPTRASLPASIVSLVLTVALAFLSYLEHARSIRPSSLLIAYLLISLLLDLSQVRTLWLRKRNNVVASVFTMGILFRLFALFAENFEKRRFLRPPYHEYPPEALGGILNRSVFWWLNALLIKGSSKELEIEDLFGLDRRLHSRHLATNFQRVWGLSLRENKSRPLLRTCTICGWRPLLASISSRALLIGFKFSQPLLINRAVSLLSEPESEDKTNIGRALIGATLLIYMGIALTTGHFRHQIYRFVTVLRGGLVSLIYENTLRLDASHAHESAAVTLMSTDIDRIAVGFEFFDSLWAGPIEIAIGVYLLYSKIGVSSVAPMLLSGCFVAATAAMSKISATTQKEWVEAVQRRVATTASTLANIKGIKMTGLSTFVDSELHQLRVTEVRVSRRFRRILSAAATISNMSTPTISTITLVVYVVVTRANTGVVLDPALAFTLLSLIALIANPIQEMSNAIPRMAAAIGCLGRIQDYLEAIGPKRHSTTTIPSTYNTDSPKMDPEKPSRTIDQSTMEEELLSLVDASFAFHSTSEPVLQFINLTLKARTWTVILGPVGSGKSTLLLALLGELDLLKGSVRRNPLLQIAYCSQDTWLPNLTIREIITGFLDFDPGWYSAVVDACALTRDFDELVHGDQTSTGSNGVSLSGGQKQRLSLARSLYSRKKLLLLDDILSGLDSTTEQLVVDRVFGEQGLCRKHGMAVLLATHAAQYAYQADHVVVFESGGRILEQGKPNTLVTLGNQKVNINTTSASGSPSNHDQGIESDTPNDGVVVEDQDLRTELTRRTGDFSLYWYYMRALGSINAIGLVVCDAIFAFCQKFPTVWLNWWSSAETDNPGSQTNFYMGIYGMFCGLCLISFTAVVVLLLHVGMPQSSIALHRRLLSAVMRAPYWFFVATDSGQILNRFSQDMSLIDMQLPLAFLNTMFLGAVCIIEAVLIASSTKWSIPMYPPVILVLYVLQRFYLRTSRQIRLLDLEAKSPLYTHFSQTLQGLVTLRAFGWQSYCIEEVYKLLDHSQRPFYLMFSIQRWLNLVLDLIIACIATVIVALATQIGDSSAGSLGVSLINILTFSQSLTFLIRAWVDLETSLGAIARVKRFEKETPSEHFPSEGSDPSNHWPEKGEVQLHEVYASYRTGDSPVLDGVSLDIKQGQKIGICGRTGSGKSSLILSILRLVEIERGTISIDGLHLGRIPRERVRRSIAVMPQEPLLLSGTLRFSVDPWENHSDDSIISALEEAGIWEIVASRGGLYIQTSNCPLSRGQKQLLCLARVLLSESKVLVLDEATSNLDCGTQKKIMEVVRRRFANCTVLVVAHDLATIRHFDKIAVLDGGKIVEWDSPDELLNAPSRFKQLWDSQQSSGL